MTLAHAIAPGIAHAITQRRPLAIAPNLPTDVRTYGLTKNYLFHTVENSSRRYARREKSGRIMTRTDDTRLRTLADFVRSVRPAWHIGAVEGAMHALIGRHELPDIAHAAIDAAFDQDIRTPAGIAHKVKRTGTAQPETGRKCTTCGGIHVVNLDEHCPLPLDAATVAKHAAEARRALRTAK